jgi:hypothetical protein
MLVIITFISGKKTFFPVENNLASLCCRCMFVPVVINKAGKKRRPP